MIISGMAENHPEISLHLYTSSARPDFTTYYDNLQNVKVENRQYKHVRGALWRSYGISRDIQRDGIDIFHGLSNEIPHNLPAQTRSVVTIHDMIAWRYPSYYHLFDVYNYRKKQQYACRHADAIIAASEQTKSDILHFTGADADKIHVIYQSCHPQFREPIPADNIPIVKRKYCLPDNYVIYISTIENRKNQITAVRALQKMNDDISLVLVGRHTKYAAIVKKEIADLRLQNRVVFLDHADFSDFPTLYASAICSLYLSEFEGFGIPVLESMCCGTPVICSNTSSIPEVGGEAAILVSPYDADTISDHVNKMHSDNALRTGLVEKSLHQALNFAPQKIIHDIYDLYTTLL
jgi:glycosyltransferase involved in cell wall biosynthesis